MASNRLTDAAIKSAIQAVVRSGNRLKMADGEGLYLLIEPRPNVLMPRSGARSTALAASRKSLRMASIPKCRCGALARGELKFACSSIAN
jgi:hypothetical protein